MALDPENNENIRVKFADSASNFADMLICVESFHGANASYNKDLQGNKTFIALRDSQMYKKTPSLTQTQRRTEKQKGKRIEHGKRRWKEKHREWKEGRRQAGRQGQI